MKALFRRVAGVSISCLLLVAPPAQSAEPDPLSRVAEYERLSNAHQVADLIALYAEDARLDFGPMGVLAGRERIRGVHEYDRAIGTVLSLESCRPQGRSAICMARERNEWLRNAGIDEIIYSESLFTFDESGLIESVSATLDPRSAEALSGAMASFAAWATDHRPEQYSLLFREDGSFDYGFEAGRQVLALLREWRESRAGAWVQTFESPQFFALRVRDAAASVSWYLTTFGLQVLDDTTAEDGSWRIVNLANEELFVEIVRDDRARPAERPHGLFKVGFRVADVDAVAARIEAMSGERPRIVDMARHGLRILQLRDPDGNIVQLSSALE